MLDIAIYSNFSDLIGGEIRLAATASIMILCLTSKYA